VKVWTNFTKMKPQKTKDKIQNRKPKTFDQKIGEFRYFKNLIDTHMGVYSKVYKTDSKRVAFLISYLEGGPSDWIYTVLERNQELWYRFQELNKMLKKIYENKGARPSSIAKIHYLKQRKRNLREYTMELSLLAVQTGYPYDVLVDLFEKGLDEELKDYLVTQEQKEKTFNDLAAKLSKIDHQSKTRQEISQTNTQYNRTVGTVPKGPISQEERDRRMRLNLCIMCGKEGHKRINCPVLFQNNKEYKHHIRDPCQE
jgi:Retrotransposon gag protein